MPLSAMLSGPLVVWVPAGVGTNVGSVALSTGLAAAALDEAAVVFVAESEPLQAVPVKPRAAARIITAYAPRVIERSLSSGEPWDLGNQNVLTSVRRSNISRDIV